MPEDKDPLIIIGRPLLSSVGALIDIGQGRLSFQVENRCAKFEHHKIICQLIHSDSCSQIETTAKVVQTSTCELEVDELQFQSVIRKGLIMIQFQMIL